MNFELGKEYIVRVTEKGIIPIDEFDRVRFFDKDHDSLEFLTDEEKQIIIESTLKELRHEIHDEIHEKIKDLMNTHDWGRYYWGRIYGMEIALDIINEKIEGKANE